eukprot:5437736-Pleurochrysis_carterae.AAC.1
MRVRERPLRFRTSRVQVRRELSGPRRDVEVAVREGADDQKPASGERVRVDAVMHTAATVEQCDAAGSSTLNRTVVPKLLRSDRDGRSEGGNVEQD